MTENPFQAAFEKGESVQHFTIDEPFDDTNPIGRFCKELSAQLHTLAEAHGIAVNTAAEVAIYACCNRLGWATPCRDASAFYRHVRENVQTSFTFGHERWHDENTGEELATAMEVLHDPSPLPPGVQVFKVGDVPGIIEALEGVFGPIRPPRDDEPSGDT